jgi:hypothetical protein
MTDATRMIKRSPSSLFGGIAVAVAVLVLWLFLGRPLSVEGVALGVAIAGGAGAWVRLANF